jgi:magnesium transporter
MDNRYLQEPVYAHLRTDVPSFSDSSDIRSVLEEIRKINVSDQIAYFYVIDQEKRLVGVIPLRRLISASPEKILKDVMIKNVVTISDKNTLRDAHETFSKHKYLSLPVVDNEKKLIGVLDVTTLTGKSLNLGQNQRFDDVFETIGIRSSYLAYLTPFSSFKHRFPWLIPTIVSGTLCALIASMFEKTIAGSLIIAFFLTLVLGLGESVSMQSLTITIRRLHLEKFTWDWFKSAMTREILTAFFLGAGTGIVVALIIFLWKHSLISGIVIGTSILLSLLTACFFGLTIPALIHHMKLDPKVAAGPVALALSDIFTLFFYFSLAKILV